MPMTVVQDKTTDEKTKLKAGDEAHKTAEEEAKQPTGVKDIVGERQEHKARGNGSLKDGKRTEAVDAYTKRIVQHLDDLMQVMQANRAMQNIEDAYGAEAALDELMEVMQANLAMQEIEDAYGVEAAKLLEVCGPGILSAAQLGMQDTLRDKQKEHQREQAMSALCVKYTAEIEEQARKLIEREVKAATLYCPEEVKELENVLRLFKPQEETERAVAEEPQSAVSEEPQSEVAQEPQLSVDTVSTSERPRKIRSAWLENELLGVNVEAAPEAATLKLCAASDERNMQETASSQTKAPQKSSCWQGCFAGLAFLILEGEV